MTTQKTISQLTELTAAGATDEIMDSKDEDVRNFILGTGKTVQSLSNRSLTEDILESGGA